jgi:hypothetical protein
MSLLPIDIVNNILSYTSDINDNVVIIQYNPFTQSEYYKIDFSSNLLWNIKSILIMKKQYPLYCTNFSDKNLRELYKCGKLNYEKQLRNKIIK